jgi:DDE superfamily endonuclease
MQQHHSNHNTAVSKTVWPNKLTDAHANDSTMPIFLYSVDGVHCRANEPSHPTLSKNTKMFSHKFNQAAFSYELAISVYHNALIWMNGPFMGSKHDVTIFRQDGLKDRTPTGKRDIADNGYKGEKNILLTLNTHDPAELRKFKVSCFLLPPLLAFWKFSLNLLTPLAGWQERVKARHETFNGRIKNFAWLDDWFRHGMDKHKICFEAVCVIVQYQLENGSPIFDA